MMPAVPISDEAPVDDAEESNAFGLAYGLGTLGTEQQLHIRAYGSIIGDSYWAADVENQIFGPEGRLGLAKPSRAMVVRFAEHTVVGIQLRAGRRIEYDKAQTLFPVHSIVFFI